MSTDRTDPLARDDRTGEMPSGGVPRGGPTASPSAARGEGTALARWVGTTSEGGARPDVSAATIEDRVQAMASVLPEARRPDLYQAIVRTVVELAEDDTDILDLKVAQAALAEMAEAFRMFRPYRGLAKVTFFGSARTRPDDPLYLRARALAARLAEHRWMIVTGAGPGIMAAAMEGAGRDASLGVNIRLPFEQGANPFIAHDPKLVEMRYFFTRKLMLIKESDAYVVLPGGFGTLDEAFELLTLLQTGKALPAPLVLLDVPDGSYWRGWQRFLTEEVAGHGLVDEEDHALYRVTADIDHAVDEILGFYRNYHSLRWVGDLLVLRLRRLPDRQQLAELNREFSDIVVSGSIRSTRALPPERAGQDHHELPRLALRFDRVSYGRLRQLIDRLNRLDP